jgi:hypothetical protein
MIFPFLLFRDRRGGSDNRVEKRRGVAIEICGDHVYHPGDLLVG